MAVKGRVDLIVGFDLALLPISPKSGVQLRHMATLVTTRCGVDAATLLHCVHGFEAPESISCEAVRLPN